jgi:hypothetical protein
MIMSGVSPTGWWNSSHIFSARRHRRLTSRIDRGGLASLLHLPIRVARDEDTNGRSIFSRWRSSFEFLEGKKLPGIEALTGGTDGKTAFYRRKLEDE